MKERIIKSALTIAITALSVYMRVMIVPLVMLIVAMAVDYISGVIAAWMLGELNSKTGKHGAIKKVCYMLLVVAAGIIDWVIYYGLNEIGVGYDTNYYFGLLVAIWLTLNEILSIIENCTRMGVPIPKFVKPIADRLKLLVENAGDKE